MSLAETFGLPEDQKVTGLRRMLFELCCSRVDEGDLRPDEVGSEVNRLLRIAAIGQVPDAAGTATVASAFDIPHPSTPHHTEVIVDVRPGEPE